MKTLQDEKNGYRELVKKRELFTDQIVDLTNDGVVELSREESEYVFYYLDNLIEICSGEINGDVSISDGIEKLLH